MSGLACFTHSLDGLAAGPDQSADQVGAWIIGRNMFGPVRGPWSEPAWNGCWCDEPPYHVPVFLLTHHPRPALHMRRGERLLEHVDLRAQGFLSTEVRGAATEYVRVVDQGVRFVFRMGA